MATLFREGAPIKTLFNLKCFDGSTIDAGTHGEVVSWEDPITLEDHPVWFAIKVLGRADTIWVMEGSIVLDE